MPSDIDPEILLLALALFHEPEQPAFKGLRTVFNPSEHDLSTWLESMRLAQWVEGLSLTTAGAKILKAGVPECLLSQDRKPVSVYRAFVGSKLLSQSVDDASWKTLSDGRSVCAALAARSLDSAVRLPFHSPKELLAVAVRTVVTDFLTRSISGLKLSPPTANSLGKDPMLAELFAAATGATDWDAGFRKLVAKALNTSSIPKTDGRWRKLSKAGFDSMARSASQNQQAQAELSAIVGVVERIARTTPTGWVPIFRAFETYREVRRIPLTEFKAAVEAAARADKLELAPLNVPSLQNDNERAQSALVMGGLTYHLVRLPK